MSFRRIIVAGSHCQRSANLLRVMSRTSRLVNVGILPFSILVLGMDIESNELFPVQMHRDGFLSGMPLGPTEAFRPAVVVYHRAIAAR